MREAIVAVFATVAEADKAEVALEAASVPRTAMRRYHREEPVGTGAATATTDPAKIEADRPRGFWAWLLGEEGHTSDWRDPSYEERYDNLYADRIQAGNVVLAVYVDTDIERVTQILSDHHPISLEEQPISAAVQEQTLGTAHPPAGATTGATGGTMNLSMPPKEGVVEERIPLAEEQVEVGKRRVESPVRVHRYVVERPVEESVTLRDEKVEIERRPASGAARPDEIGERVVEVHESHEEPDVRHKGAQVVEEVVVRREATERTETVHDTARKEEVEVERDANAKAKAPRTRTPRP